MAVQPFCVSILVSLKEKEWISESTYCTVVAKNSTVFGSVNKPHSPSSETENLSSVLSCKCKALSSFIQNKRCIAFSLQGLLQRLNPKMQTLKVKRWQQPQIPFFYSQSINPACQDQLFCLISASLRQICLRLFTDRKRRLSDTKACSGIRKPVQIL